MADRNRDRDGRWDGPGSPDPTQDSWSAWLPHLDPPASPPAGPPATPLPQASGPPPAAPSTPPPVPPATKLPYAAAPVPRWAMPPGGYVAPPTSYFGWAVLCTIACFMPFGVVAIVKASQVKPRWAQGDLDGARRASRTAKAWCLLAAAVWPGAFLLFGCLGMMAGGHLSMHL
jgi:hypothetical protein